MLGRRRIKGARGTTLGWRVYRAAHALVGAEDGNVSHEEVDKDGYDEDKADALERASWRDSGGLPGGRRPLLVAEVNGLVVIVLLTELLVAQKEAPYLPPSRHQEPPVTAKMAEGGVASISWC
jgi:hypothetical protein